MTDSTPSQPSQGAAKQRRGIRLKAAQAAQGLRRADASPLLLRAVRASREMLPGDERFGDELSTAGGRPSEVLARHLTEMGVRHASASREAGVAALQLWQAVSERAGRGAGAQELVVVFTDLVEFSSWVLDVGDDVALELLRDVWSAVKPPIEEHGGRVVKHLGDGFMATFPNAEGAVRATLDAQQGLAAVEVAGHCPKLRAGVHLGRPRKVGGDYLGADVNIAARLTEAARGGEVLISDATLAAIDATGLDVRQRRRFRAKGTPRDLEVFAVSRASR